MNKTALPALLDALAAYVDERVEEKVAEKLQERVEALRGAVVYTSDDLPPGYKRRTFVRLAPRVPGARRSGHLWVVDRAAWDAYQARAAEERRARRHPLPNTKPQSKVTELARVIVAANARPTKEAS